MLKPFENFYKGKQVLITGHTGFKGSWLSIWLLELGANVIGYALGPPTTPSLFEILSLEKKLTSIIGDIRDLKKLVAVFKEYEPEIVFHLAAQPLVRRSYREPIETYETNVMGTVHLFEACRRVPSTRVLVNVTSDKCYGNREWSSGYKETDPMGGSDPYSSSKACAELITDAYSKSFFNPEDPERDGMCLASARSGNVVGGGDWSEDRLIPDCIKAFVKNSPVLIRYPDFMRPWQHVLEPLSGYLLLAQRLYQDGPAFAGAWNFGPNDCDVKPVRWLVEVAREIWGNNATWQIDKRDHPNEVSCIKLDHTKAKSKLNWSPKWDLRLALEKTIEWYKAYYNHEEMLSLTIKQIESYEKCIMKEK